MRALKKLRLDKKLTQGDLARETGVALTTIYMFENNKIQELKPKLLKRLAKALDSTIEEICKEYVEDEMCNKECLNQVCLLNHNKKCRSLQVCNGAYCQNENIVTSKQKNKKSKFRI
ncbi:helix-turn-helix transcriptional regulator [Clostridium butyricum]